MMNGGIVRDTIAVGDFRSTWECRRNNSDAVWQKFTSRVENGITDRDQSRDVRRSPVRLSR